MQTLRKLLQKRSLHLIKKYTLLPLLIILAFVILIFMDSVLKIKTITVTGSNKLSSLRGLQDLYGKNMLLLNESSEEQFLITRNPSLRKITITKILPDTLHVDVVTTQPFAQIAVENGFLLVSEEGRILSKTKEKSNNYPTLQYYQKLQYSLFQSGDTIEYKEILSALHFLKKSRDLGLAVDTIDINGMNMIALQLKDRQILFTTEKKQEIQDYQLEAIIRQFSIEGKYFSILDLRFDKPIIQIIP